MIDEETTNSPSPVSESGTPGELSAIEPGSQQLSPGWIKADRLMHWIIAGVTGVAGAAYLVVQWLTFGMALPWALATTSGVIVLFAALAYRAHVYPKLWFRDASYEMSETAIVVRVGVIFKSVKTVPRSRVQHTDVGQGPIQRRYGIATLSIHTAGTQHAKVELAGIAKERAELIRDHLIARASTPRQSNVKPTEPASESTPTASVSTPTADVSTNTTSDSSAAGDSTNAEVDGAS